MALPPSDYLAWFLGPKAENAKQFEALITDIVRDYSHWRKNYFPDDPILLTQQFRSSLDENQSLLDSRLAELLAALRRNFPFYSPRYIAHELSDTLMPAVVGYMAGLLYNPNNVTPEAAPVTTELEIEVTSEILEMLGFRAPPRLPPTNADPIAYYKERGRSEYGWAHLTSGGTIANIEALWVARQIRYFPLSAKHLATLHNLNIDIKLPSGHKTFSLRDIDDYQLLLIKPNESVYLLGKLVTALLERRVISDPAEVWRQLEQSPFAITKGFGETFEKFPPKILVASSRHYSVAKAANVLGIGQANIIPIRMTDEFRMDVDHLRTTLSTEVLARRQVPLCVVASAGTTEEGAVDPIDAIVDLRRELGKSHNLSFWLHTDAAWGGYIRSLFRLDEKDKAEALCGYITRMLKTEKPNHWTAADNSQLKNWHAHFSQFLLERIARLDSVGASAHHIQKAITADHSADPSGAFSPVQSETPDGARTDEKQSARSGESKQLTAVVEELLAQSYNALENGDYTSYRNQLIELLHRILRRRPDCLPDAEAWLKTVSEDGSNLRILADWLRDYVAERVAKDRTVHINWPPNEVAKAFLAFPRSESVTIDPHKMGYAPYPAGCIAFRNDLVRSFILQEAPYITSAERDYQVHVPPRYLKKEGNIHRVVTESFSPFILEGSRPGAMAAGLWLAMKCVPYNPRGHGAIVRSSLISAKLLHVMLARYGIEHKVEEHSSIAFIPLLKHGPHTNLVTFTVVPKAFRSLAAMNALTERVYDTFSIQAELGEREHSYSQPFFLSKTKMSNEYYPAAMLKPFFERAGLARATAQEYRTLGMTVLRATIMNPYLVASRTLVAQDFCGLFVEELLKSAGAGSREIAKNPPQ
jgi:glutamate/tyrosine decarboxylase-like PLP-dependent enzyme